MSSSARKGAQNFVHHTRLQGPRGQVLPFARWIGSARAWGGARGKTRPQGLHAHADNFRLLFDHLLDENTPLVFHCAAGKDRTGIAAALILLALGVPRSVILDDYLLTGLHWKVDAEHKTDLPPEVAKVLVSVDAAFLHAAFKAIDEDFGGIENYLGEQLGIDPLRQERLRALYLEG